MNKSKIVIAALIWLVLLAIGTIAWKLVIEPRREGSKTEQARLQAEANVQATTGSSRYTTELTVGIDSFSGYAIFRSEEFKNQLANHGIKVNLIDDGANYSKRAEALEKGTLQFALFPADALIKTFSKLDYPPATIVAIVDETRGADAMLAYSSRYANVDALNDESVRFVLVGDSPSETLARIVVRDFGLNKTNAKSFDMLSSPEQVFERYKNAKPTTDEVYVVWEPFVSQMKLNDKMKVLVDSSKFTGYIVDTLVVNRDYLLKQQPNVEEFLKCYFRACYAYRDVAKLEALILDDAKQTKLNLTSDQAKEMVKGIQWKNTQENFAHFALRQASVVHIEDILGRISNVLTSTHAIDESPFEGKMNRLFYDVPLRKLQESNFHPGLQSESLRVEEKVREESELTTLGPEQWKSLVTIGTLSLPELVFSRGSANLDGRSQRTLSELADTLRTWPRYYLMIRGNASKVGDQAANQTLAAKRAAAALEYLRQVGIPEARMKVVEGEITGETRVSFSVGELPY